MQKIQAMSRGNNYRRRRKAQLLLLLLPFLALVIIFAYVPIFGWSYAFINYKPGISIFDSKFIGLRNFRFLFSPASDFGVVLRNTLVLSSLGLCCSVLPVILAILLTLVRQQRYSKVVQTVVSMPNFISWVLVYAMVFLLLSSENSALNTLLMSTGLIQKPLNILADDEHAWFVQIAIAIWKNTGYSSIIYLSAISSIDEELYQAAAVDGANRFQKIIHVLLPGIVPTYFVLLMLSISNMLSNGFDQYWLFGNGMTWDRLEVFDTYAYRLGIMNMQYSMSTALGIFKSIVSIFLLTIANGGSKLLRGESIF